MIRVRNVQQQGASNDALGISHAQSPSAAASSSSSGYIVDKGPFVGEVIEDVVHCIAPFSRPHG
jgi:hypothetical protein